MTCQLGYLMSKCGPIWKNRIFFHIFGAYFRTIWRIFGGPFSAMFPLPPVCCSELHLSLFFKKRKLTPRFSPSWSVSTVTMADNGWDTDLKFNMYSGQVEFGSRWCTGADEKFVCGRYPRTAEIQFIQGQGVFLGVNYNIF